MMEMGENISYKLASEKGDFEAAKGLFAEYAQLLGVDLSFQDFEGELETLGEQYCAPAGALLLAYDGELAVGCAGVRRLEENVAELKRMYVKDGYRGHKIGLQLLERCIETARELGYEKMRLDTLGNMTKAQELYRSFGFYEIPAYRFNPLAGTIYMERKL